MYHIHVLYYIDYNAVVAEFQHMYIIYTNIGSKYPCSLKNN